MANMKETVEDVRIEEIDLQSTVNVRAEVRNEDAEKVLNSIKESGFHRDFPVRLRPHPNPDESGYKYENVAGQTRIEACRRAGIETIPAIIVEMDNDAAIQFSWNENDKRSDIPESRKAALFQEKYKTYLNTFGTKTRAFEETAKFYSVSAGTIKESMPLIVLPEEVAKEHDAGIIKKNVAKAIADAYDSQNEEESRRRMLMRHGWWKGKNSSERKTALEVMKEAPTGAEIENLEKMFLDRINGGNAETTVRFPKELGEPLEEYRKRRGLPDKESAIRVAINDALRDAQIIQ